MVGMVKHGCVTSVGAALELVNECEHQPIHLDVLIPQYNSLLESAPGLEAGALFGALGTQCL